MYRSPFGIDSESLPASLHGGIALTSPGGSVGLAERRALKEFQDRHFPDIRKRLDKAVGFPVELEIEWEKVTAGLKTDSYYHELTGSYFDPVIGGMEDVGQDAMGRVALKEGLKKIVITLDRERADTLAPDDADAIPASSWPVFDQGVLWINIGSRGARHGGERREAIQKNVEAKLQAPSGTPDALPAVPPQNTAPTPITKPDFMGLAARRALKQFQDNQFPLIKKRLQEAAGFPVELDIAWEKIVEGTPPDDFFRYLTCNYFDPLGWALQDVGQDAMGKAALKEGLKKIVITHDPAGTIATLCSDKALLEQGWPKFEDGVLWINAKPGDGGYSVERRAAIRTNLEAKL